MNMTWWWLFYYRLLVALVLQRSITFFSAKLRLPKKLAAVLLVLVFYAVLGVLLFWLAMSVFAGVKVLVERLPAVYANDIEPFLMDVFESVERIMLRFDMTVADFLEDFHVTLSNLWARSFPGFRRQRFRRHIGGSRYPRFLWNCTPVSPQPFSPWI